ncbi:MAG: DUF3857 domain-containing protein [Candidatus Omnitrophota bacterium]|nr:DUF3857 domain-containing protein [Candidatus Omnitrophota bacterium]
MRHLKLSFTIAFAIFIASCAGLEKRHLEKADAFSYKSELFFQKALESYQEALKNSSHKSLINFKLAKLYFQHADYQKCVDCILDQDDLESRKLLAYCFYKTGDYTQSLSIFNNIGELDDDEYLFYYARACEKHNLFDQAKNLYSKIKTFQYLSLAKERLAAIDASIKANELLILQPEIAKLIEQAPAQEAFPQAGALILLADEKIEVLPNDTQVFYQHYIIKILNERGKKFGEIDIDYDSTFEKVELDFARTIKPDGEVALVGAKHIRDVSRYLNFPLYSNARAVIISMPEITIGATIEYKLKTIRSRLIDKKEFSTGYVLQNDVPIILAKFRVFLPSGRDLNLRLVNTDYNYFSAKLEPNVTVEGNTRIYSWEFNAIPEIIAEPAMPPISEINTAIFLSTFKSWQTIYKWWWNLAKDKIDTDDKMKQLVKSLTLNFKTDKEKARAIYNWSVENIRYVAIEYGQAGFEPHKAADIFTNKYGDCKDQSILLISLLKEAGLKAFPVLIGTKDNFKLIEDFPTLLFNHCIVVVKIDNELIFLDPTGETVSFGDLPIDDQDRKVMVFFEDKAEILLTPDFGPRHNHLETETAFIINPDESVSGRRNILTNGFYDQGQRFYLKYTQPIIFEEGLKEKVHSITPGGKLIDYSIENVSNLDKPIKLVYRFSGPEILTRAGKARVIPQLGAMDLSIVAKDSRRYPIDFGVLSSKETLMSVKLPRNLKVKFLPQTIKYNTKWLSFSNSYNLEDSRLVFRQNFTVKQKVISNKDYRLFKASLERLSRKLRQCIVLEETEF